MILLRDALVEIHTLLERCGVRHCLVGGFATAIHGIPRFTDDVDFLVHAQDLARKYGELAAKCTSLAAPRELEAVGKRSRPKGTPPPGGRTEPAPSAAPTLAAPFPLR